MKNLLDVHQGSKGTQAIGRAAAILKTLAYDNLSGQGLAEIAGNLGLERPTVYRILQRLVLEGLVTQDPVSRNYRLGPLIYELGLLAFREGTLREACRPALVRLAQASGDTVFLIALRGNDSVCLDRAQGDYPVQALLLDPGQRRPAGIGAGSIALLATMPAVLATQVVDNNARILGQEGEDLTQIAASVNAARSAGFALKRPPAMPDILSIAVALVDRDGKPTAALSISGLAHRISSRLDFLIALLTAEAKSFRDARCGAELRAVPVAGEVGAPI